MSKYSNTDEIMKSLWGDVIKALLKLNFERKDILKYTTLGTLANLHRYNQEEIVDIVNREIHENKIQKQNI